MHLSLYLCQLRLRVFCMRARPIEFHLECLVIRLGLDELLALDMALFDIYHVEEHRTEYPPMIGCRLRARYRPRGRQAYRPKRNANGMLALLLDAVMIADETKGPMNAEVFPT